MTFLNNDELKGLSKVIEYLENISNNYKVEIVTPLEIRDSLNEVLGYIVANDFSSGFTFVNDLEELND